MDKLKRERTTIRAQFTKLENAVVGIVDDQTQLVNCRLMLEKLELQWKSLKDVQMQFICDAIDDDWMKAEQDALDEAEMRYDVMKLKLVTMIEKHQTKPMIEPIPSGSGAGSSNGAATGGYDTFQAVLEQQARILQQLADARQPTANVRATQGIELPKIKQLKFSGEHTDWLSFRNMYETLIHSNDNVGKVQKLAYLQSACKDGKAESLVKYFSLNEAGYDAAWLKLTEEYGKLKYSVNAHIKEFFSQPQVSPRNPTELQKLAKTSDAIVQAIRALGQDAMSIDFWLIHIIFEKLDERSKEAWMIETSDQLAPKFEDFIKFLSARGTALDNCHPERKKTNNDFKTTTPGVKERTKGAPAQSTPGRKPRQCSYCSGEHALWACEKFRLLSSSSRLDFIRKANSCENCLGKHDVQQCSSEKGCKQCGQRHNTSLHDAFGTVASKSAAPAQGPSTSATTAHASTLTPPLPRKGVLATAIVEISDSQGNWQLARALLDSGSELNYMTTRMAQTLRLKTFKAPVEIEGIGGVTTAAHGTVRTIIRSRMSEFTDQLDFLTLADIVGVIPVRPIDISGIELPPGVTLADPAFGKPSEVDLLLGSDTFYAAITGTRLAIGDDKWLQHTRFGYIVVGTQRFSESQAVTSTNLSNTRTKAGVARNVKDEVEFEAALKRFWELEERKSLDPAPQTAEEKRCEEHFLATHRRDEEGRYIVQLPMRDSIDALGSSKRVAMNRFLSIERKFGKSEIWPAYVDFMREYRALDHMESCDCSDEEREKTHYFLPHHPVVRPDKLTTKIRVVFDASMPTTSGRSLNDLLENGPKVQRDLFPVLLQFRENSVAFIFDLKKMYRQFLVDSSQRHLQSIMWRETEDDAMQFFHLKTVTYGTGNGAYLATRGLKQLASDEGEAFPVAKRILDGNCYVDDVVASLPTLEEAIQASKELKQLLAKGGLESHKWASNHLTLLETIGEVDEHPRKLKVLGIAWDKVSDELYPLVPPFQIKSSYTKRDLAAEIPRLYDPLGLIGPVVLKAKVMLQRLWQYKHLDWDAEISREDQETWETFRVGLTVLNEHAIARCVRPEGTIVAEIHGFCDASQDAYGACVYLRTTNEGGEHDVRLLCSKSRVAPLKRVTMPRLELLGATLLAELVATVKSAIQQPILRVVYHCDNSTVLSWINRPSADFKQFVANRVAAIHQLSNPDQWRYIESAKNPADCLSRGLTGDELQRSDIWWNGPPFLRQDESEWPRSNLDDFCAISEIEESAGEIRTKPLSLVATPAAKSATAADSIFERVGGFAKIVRIAAFCARFLRRLLDRVRTPKADRTKLRIISMDDISEKIQHILPLQIAELRQGERIMVGLVQREAYSEELRMLKLGRHVPKRSSLRKMTPFVDDFGLVRVGGRLKSASLKYDQRHQIVLPRRHRFARLLAQHTHEINCHAAPQLLQYTLRQRYWIANDNALARDIFHHCIRCFRARPIPMSQLMGPLPADRVTATSRPFTNVGIDYCGPFLLTTRIRGRAPSKIWIAIFICLVTRATHIEIVFDCTTAEFIAALTRFISRRGLPRKIRSDNATTFQGAKNEMQRLFESDGFQTAVFDECQKRQIEWTFSPPASPHHGGIWEAAVKSFKLHLKRLTSEDRFTAGEWLTLIARIEACLNSRPISPMSSSPDDVTPLTPGHFLIGRPLNALPEEDLVAVKVSTIQRWQYLHQKAQIFWTRWQNEVLHHMQQRSKWNVSTAEPRVGDLVLMVDKDAPPLKWRTARIKKIHRGTDGKCRVVTVWTPTGEYDRATTQLCLFPIEDYGDDPAVGT